MFYQPNQHRRNLLLLAAQNLQQQQLILAEIERRRRIRRRLPRPRQLWMNSFFEHREEWGSYYTRFRHMKMHEPVLFKQYLRVDPETFDDILGRLLPNLTRPSTNFRCTIEPDQRLMVALRYYAAGPTYRGLRFDTVIAHNTISKIVLEVSEAIIENMLEEVMPYPETVRDWKAIADKFGERWNFSHALGALDGKHVRIIKPKKSGTTYYNYKGYFSVVLMALVDADYKFIWTQIGNNGAASDPQIYNASNLAQSINDGTVNFPPSEPLSGDDTDMPYFIISDDAFALKKTMMKPFSKRYMDVSERVFNYRLSRARRVVENAFGILAQRFQCLLGMMRQKPNNVTTIVQSLVVLHNYLRIRFPVLNPQQVDTEDHENGVIIPGEWRDEIGNWDNINHVHNRRNPLVAAKVQRLYLKNYYNSTAGSVEWQLRMI